MTHTSQTSMHAIVVAAVLSGGAAHPAATQVGGSITRGGPMRWSTTVAVAIATVAATVVVEKVAQAGVEVHFLIPATSSQPEPPGGATDKIIYTGGRIVNITSSAAAGDTCPEGTYPVQNGVLVDPGGGRSGRIIIVTIRPDPVSPGNTIVPPISFGQDCRIGGVEYKQYSGTLE